MLVQHLQGRQLSLSFAGQAIVSTAFVGQAIVSTAFAGQAIVSTAFAGQASEIECFINVQVKCFIDIWEVCIVVGVNFFRNVFFLNLIRYNFNVCSPHYLSIVTIK